LSSGQTDSALRGEQLACAFEDGEVTLMEFQFDKSFV
jgi:hypothetical protein